MQAMRPKPVFDDIVTTVRYALARWGVASAPMTEAQRVESRMQPGVRKVDIPLLPTKWEQDHAVNSNVFWDAHFRAEQEEEERQKKLRVTFRR